MLNLDTKPLDNPAVRTLITDITDSGQVFNALSSYTGLHEFDPNLAPEPIDAVVHFAAIPRIMIVPDNEVFCINAMGTYNVIEAAAKLGIRKVVIASSETTYGVVFAHEHRDPDYFPLDEEYDVNPFDSYALSKVVNEKTARAFAVREGIDIDARDLGQITRLAIEKDGLGFQVFNAVNDDTSSNLPTAELLKHFYPNVPVKGKLVEFESLLSNKKTREVLGFKEEHNWRKYVKA